MTTWISVKDRLPELKPWNTIHQSDDVIGWCFEDNVRDPFWACCRLVKGWEGRVWWDVDGCDDDETVAVIYWMPGPTPPLPEPPEEEEKDA